jgi:protein disulfide-isomerase A6
LPSRRYLWLQGGQQPALENNFGVGGFGYPALVVYSPKKKAFVVSSDAYEPEHVKEFLKRVSSGFVRPQPITGGEDLARVADVAAWDGGEAPEIFEDEIDLADLMKDEF